MLTEMKFLCNEEFTRLFAGKSGSPPLGIAEAQHDRWGVPDQSPQYLGSGPELESAPNRAGAAIADTPALARPAANKSGLL
jgi:hypothetical protein